MPVTNFPEYVQVVSQILNDLISTGQANLLNLQIDQRSTLRGYIAGLVRFGDNSELHFREFIDLTQAEPRLAYAYHYQDAAQLLVFRYDNAAHRPSLPQLEHKHTSTSSVIPSPPPTLQQVIDEILIQ